MRNSNPGCLKSGKKYSTDISEIDQAILSGTEPGHGPKMWVRSALRQPTFFISKLIFVRGGQSGSGKEGRFWPLYTLRQGLRSPHPEL